VAQESVAGELVEEPGIYAAVIKSGFHKTSNDEVARRVKNNYYPVRVFRPALFTGKTSLRTLHRHWLPYPAYRYQGWLKVLNYKKFLSYNQDNSRSAILIKSP
jgi:hypothetical protein